MNTTNESKLIAHLNSIDKSLKRVADYMESLARMELVKQQTAIEKEKVDAEVLKYILGFSGSPEKLIEALKRYSN